MNTRLGKVKACLIVFWLSIFAMLLINTIENNATPQEEISDNQKVVELVYLEFQPDTVVSVK